jgi:rRNA processing protein Gar1
LGLEIYDEKANSIGRISDVIGPVFKPYFKIKPSRPNPSTSFSSLVGEPLYTMPEPRGKGMVPKQSKSKGKNMKDKRQSSNKYRYGKSSNTRTYSKSYKPRNKSPK